MPSQGMATDVTRQDVVAQKVAAQSMQPETTKAVVAVADAEKNAASAEYDKKMDGHQVKRMVDSLNQTMGEMKSDLVFSVDDDTGLKLVKVVDRQTKEVIRQIPNEEMVRFVKVMDELRGVLLKDKV
ncbi:flagellar protein FlaG [Laribacter hongkongensis]|uniref:flagellar protein FlaG n=1 Tax=Laribacter hongkongensis TaxID=168471 RepID=UPI001EFC49C2|nr:flagellar protein FlaG [Laribacter hongkongensis]MCG9078049.1 flagellar protein FlaG [Laribacter hongkongensis]